MKNRLIISLSTAMMCFSVIASNTVEGIAIGCALWVIRDIILGEVLFYYLNKPTKHTKPTRQ